MISVAYRPEQHSGTRLFVMLGICRNKHCCPSDGFCAHHPPQALCCAAHAAANPANTAHDVEQEIIVRSHRSQAMMWVTWAPLTETGSVRPAQRLRAGRLLRMRTQTLSLASRRCVACLCHISVVVYSKHVATPVHGALRDVCLVYRIRHTYKACVYII